LKRSNRLVLLVGVFLAIVAFIGILLLSGGGGPKSSTPEVPTELPTVIATQDIPLGTAIRADQVKVEVKPITGRDTDAFGDVSQVVGKIVRQKVTTGAAVTATTLTGGQQGQILSIDCPPTQRCISVQVDQVSGVGTVIKTGDYVDMVVGLTGDKFPVVTLNPQDKSITVVAGLNSTSVKLLISGMQVLGTLLPPPPPTTTAEGAAPAAPSGQPSTALTTGGLEMVIVSVNAQQAEILKFAQLDGSISLALRSPADFVDPSGNPIVSIPVATKGITLKELVDIYGVLRPQLVEAILPAQ
jgi:Flp pilus assembly protein CpaB